MANGYNQYIGMRYVPIIDGEWSQSKAYEPLVVVVYNGNSYISKTYVPAGTLPTNETYWILAANYNAQVEQYRQEVRQYQQTVDEFDGDITELQTNVGTLTTDLNGVDGRTTTLEGSVGHLNNALVSSFPIVGLANWHIQSTTSTSPNSEITVTREVPEIERATHYIMIPRALGNWTVTGMSGFVASDARNVELHFANRGTSAQELNVYFTVIGLSVYHVS